MNIETYPPEKAAEILSAAPPSPQMPQQPVPPPRTVPPVQEKQRRVGTFTLGITLVMLGVMVPLSLVFGGSMWRLLQFAPLALVALGVEILVYAVRFKSGSFRYDGVSIFLVVAITLVTLTGSLVAPPIAHAIHYGNRESEVCDDVRFALEQELAAAGCTGNAQVYNDEDNAWRYVLKGEEPEDWQLSAYVHVGQMAGEDVPEKGQVARIFAAMAAAAAEQGSIRELSLEYRQSGPEESVTYHARLLGTMIQAMSPEEMEQWMHTEIDVRN